jgi:SagB-type dehydrogenase family enzyme
MMILVIEETGLVMLDYATRECVDCSDVALALLKAADTWQGALPLLDSVDAVDRRELAEEARALVDGGFLVVEGTEQARLEERYDELWEWDVRAGLYHFSIKDAEWMDKADQMDDLGVRVQERERIPFFTTNEGFATVVPLERPSLDEGIFSVLSRRRTLRVFTGRAVPRDAIRDCLYAGLAITEFVDEPVLGMGRLPLKMTPSGGARNPYEAYLYARDVDGLPPGIYHYSATENSLGLVAEAPLPAASTLLAGQGWADGAAAVILLVANFRRTAWKYSHPNVYRALFHEAGHIGQNVMIAATARGLTAAPTAAFCDTAVERLLGVDRITQAVFYALVIGEPAPGASPAAY